MGQAIKNRIVILGGGAIGSVIAAALAQKQRERTILIGRRDHARIINERGLKVEGLFAERVSLDAREAVDFPLDDALLVVTVKAVDLVAALRGLAPWLRPTTAVLLLQNGLGIKELALEAFRSTPLRPDHVFIGIVAMGSTFVAPGHVRCFGGNIRLEPAFAATPFFDLLHGLPFKVEPSRDIAVDLWTKLLVNIVINPLSVLLQGHNRLVAEERFDGLKEPILAEGCAVAAAEGVSHRVDAAFVNRFVRSDNITSMLQDFRRGRRSEIDFLNGAIAALGRKHGIPTPVNGYVTALIHALEALRT
ncbi:MAG: 2-dehydropantoate 2-reductase [Candidatus Aminicenantes bacterium]|nr:2-dehydropantoate 2-reductase [Candidatus Aminicenantes bacterium]